MRSIAVLCAIATPTNALTWQALDAQLPKTPAPTIIDAVHHRSSPPPLPDDAIVLYRERNGWCPYSERVWLALEAKGIEHTTVLIDNTGHGRRPSWYSGTTPQIRWADGKTQGESLDLVRELDVRFPATPPLFEASGVDAAISAFRRCFPRNARPSSRAAYLFSYDGPLPRSTFEDALDATDAALGSLVGKLTFKLGANAPRGAPLPRASAAPSEHALTLVGGQLRLSVATATAASAPNLSLIHI